MSSLRPLADGVVADLRERGLLPVAVLLVVALIAVPLFLSRGPEPVAVAPAPPVDPVDTGGLPGPAEALGERPLVTLASLDSSSDLESFDPRDPFEPLRSLEAIESDPAGTAAPVPTDVPAAVASGGPGGDAGFADALGGAPAVGGDVPALGDTGDFGGGSGGAAPSPAPDTTSAPDAAPAPPASDPRPAPVRRFTYSVDLKFDGPETTRRKYTNLPRLAMLPRQSSPVLIFLGVGASAEEAVFLVDASLRASSEGEGTCKPSPEDCATVALGPDELQVFFDDQGRRYVIQVDRIRAVRIRETDQDKAAQASSEAEPASIGDPVRRFLPVLTELVVTGGQG